MLRPSVLAQVPFAEDNRLQKCPVPGGGTKAEAAVLNALVGRGYDVPVPFGEGLPYDLIVDLGGRDFLRVQCKRAWPLQGCVVFNTRSTDHGRGPQPYVGLADVFGVYFPPTKTVYMVPIEAVASFEGRLRLEPTRNNQKRLIRFASEFEIERWSQESLREQVTGAMMGAEPELNFA